VFWLALLPYFLFPDYPVLASQIAITVLFALSPDLSWPCGYRVAGHAVLRLGPMRRGSRRPAGAADHGLIGAVAAGSSARGGLIVSRFAIRPDRHARYGFAAENREQRELADRRCRRPQGVKWRSSTPRFDLWQVATPIR
jgi:hypothetical protein